MNPPQHPRADASATLPRVVLDSNTVLDWLLFRDVHGTAVGAAVSRGAMRWIATAEMRGELAHVLGRGDLDCWQPDLDAFWSAWSKHCVEVPTPQVAGSAKRFRCTDSDDQKFIDLAVAQEARWLLTRDRAVLKLARRLRDVGVDVLTPAAWAARHAVDTALTAG